MNFHDKPGWGIALRVVLVLVLIGGMFWVTKAAYYQGLAAGAGKAAPGYMMFSGGEDDFDFHHMDGYRDHYQNSGGMFYHHPGKTTPYGGYPGHMGYPSGGSFASGFFHLLFGVLGFFLLARLIFGFGGMHRYGPMGPGYHGGHYRYHRCNCPECAGEGMEEKAPEKAPASKTKKKVA